MFIISVDLQSSGSISLSSSYWTQFKMISYQLMNTFFQPDTLVSDISCLISYIGLLLNG